MPSAGAIVPPIITPLRRHGDARPSSQIDTATYIELETETAECKIYFSTNGSKPNPFQMKVGGRECTFKYRGPFTLKSGKRTLKCLALARDGLHESNVVTKTFQVEDVGPPDDDSSLLDVDVDPWADDVPKTSKSYLRSGLNKKKKNMHNSRKTDIKEAWGNDTGYDYIPTPGISAEPTNGHITSEKTPDHLTNSVNLPDGPFNPTNYSGTQMNFWGVSPAGGVPMPGAATNPLGSVSLPYGTTPNQLGYMTSNMLQGMNCPRLSINDLRRLMQEVQQAQKPMPAIELPKEPEPKPESPGCGDWKGNLEHIYAHLIERCKKELAFRTAVGNPKFCQIVHADFDEEDSAYLLTVSFRKPGASIRAAAPKPKPTPAPAPAPKPKPTLKGTATAIGAAKKFEKKQPVKPKPKPEPKKDPFFVTEEYEAEGTLKPWEYFNAERDCEALRAAMKGVGTDERVIVDIMGYRISTQRQEIVKMFKTMFGKDLREELKGETSGDFKEVLKSLCMTPDEYDASEIKRAVKGLGTDEDALIEILCTRTNAQIKAIREAYTRLYDKDLLKDVKSDTSGDFKQLLTYQIQGQRKESPEYDKTEAEQDAKNLYKAGEGKKWGTDESTFNQIICRRSFAHLRAVFEEYSKLSKRTIEEAIKSEFSGDIKNSLIAVVRVIQNKPGYFAKKLQKAMKGGGTDDQAMVRICVSRCEIDMVQIKKAFEEEFKGTLAEWIKDDTSGDYREMLLALIGERPAPIPTAEEIEDAEGEPELEEVEEEVLELVKTYREVYGKDLKKELHGELSGNFRDVILGLCLSPTEFDAEQLRKAMKANRPSGNIVDRKKARKDAKDIMEAGEKKMGTDESRFNVILCSRSFPQLRATFEEFAKIANKEIEDTIKSEMSGDLKRGMLAIGFCPNPEKRIIIVPSRILRNPEIDIC
ncbi:hypothetical protein LSH36_919g01024 [Paralvinella palmiformis]|uniref:Annexin n=1 Tax=Paralvinella palmiformis TaxID=53620 RepID=A0AAD9IYP6_9ANNE|nr:hypothetical protein LSH36_919g01024 [Paralvinella palmiformis]